MRAQYFTCYILAIHPPPQQLPCNFGTNVQPLLYSSKLPRPPHPPNNYQAILAPTSSPCYPLAIHPATTTTRQFALTFSPGSSRSSPCLLFSWSCCLSVAVSFNISIRSELPLLTASSSSSSCTSQRTLRHRLCRCRCRARPV